MKKSRMVVAIRADAAVEIGIGHIMRCLTLASLLKENNFQVFFICSDLNGHLHDYICEQGFRVEVISYSDKIQGCNCEEFITCLAGFWEQDALLTKEIIQRYGQIDWLIVDHYAFDERWERKIKPLVKRIMVIDDLANRFHICDILLDQNLAKDAAKRYQSLIPAECLLLLGPRYAILRSEFTQARQGIRHKNAKIRRILVFFGGTDPLNETEKAMIACEMLQDNIAVDVVVGIANPHRDKIKQICERNENFYYHCQINYMARLMSQADIAIGAGGSTVWERCCLGLPAIVCILAENQEELTKVAAEHDVLINMGWYNKITAADYVQILNKITEEQLRTMQNKALELVDGLGNNRIVEKMLLTP